jgi:hypothetical protein
MVEFPASTYNPINSYRGNATIKKGESRFEPRIDDESHPKFIAGVTNVPNQGPETVGYVPREDVVLSWPTFTDAAKEAGYSRLVGGIHIAAGNEGGLYLGNMVGEAVWKRYEGLIKKKKKTKGSRKLSHNDANDERSENQSSAGIRGRKE